MCGDRRIRNNSSSARSTKALNDTIQRRPPPLIAMSTDLPTRCLPCWLDTAWSAARVGYCVFVRLSRIVVKNFRNLADIDVPLSRHTVIVGENRSGKSNLLHAMRLVLDNTLSGDQRRLQPEDFWDGAPVGEDTTTNDERVEVSLDITEFEDEPSVVATLSDALVSGDPLTARLTYRWEPDPFVDDSAVYRARLYGGGDDNPIFSSDVRDRLITVFMHALRDVDSDVRSWRRSPLRALLEGAAQNADAADLAAVQEAMNAANNSLNNLDP